jgi:hypothetical protein
MSSPLGTMLSLSNAFNSAFKELDLILYRATAKLENSKTSRR